MKFKISVIIPVYNVENHLKKCIDSLLNQTFTDFELLLIDDGSKDNSAVICDEYERKDKRIKVIHKKNEGVSKARNVGIELAQSDYITFVDSDDYVDKDFLMTGYTAMIKHNAEMYISGLVMEYFDNNIITNSQEFKINETNIFNTKDLFEAWERIYPQILISGPCNKLYKTSLLKKENIRFDESMSLGEDTNFNLDYFEFVNKVYFDSNVFYHYRRGNNESLFTRFCKNIYEIHDYVYFNKFNALLKKLDYSDYDFINEKFLIMIITCINHFFINKRETTSKQRYEIIEKVSNNRLINEININKLSNSKFKLICTLLKRKHMNILYFIFRLKNI